MNDGGRKAAWFFRAIWIFFLLILSLLAFQHTYEWNPDMPFITRELLEHWILVTLTLGVYASLSGWWEATTENNPKRKLPLLQASMWSMGHVTYVLLVLIFYVGVLLGLLFALDSTLHRYAVTVGSEAIYLGIDSKYLFLAAFGVVAIGQTAFVGTSMARSFVVLLDKRLGIE